MPGKRNVTTVPFYFQGIDLCPLPPKSPECGFIGILYSQWHKKQARLKLVEQEIAARLPKYLPLKATGVFL